MNREWEAGEQGFMLELGYKIILLMQDGSLSRIKNPNLMYDAQTETAV